MPPPTAIANTTSTPIPALPSVQARRSRNVALICTLALIALGLGWELVWAPTGVKSLAVKVVPLALGVAGLAKYRLQTFRWMSLLVWLYAAEGAVRAASDVGLSAQLAWVELILSLALFAACAWHVKARFASASLSVPAAGPAVSSSRMP